MKSTRALVMILISLIVGAAAVWLAARWVGQQATENTTRVVVANTTIEAGAQLLPNMLRTVNWPSDALPTGAFQDAKALEGRVSGVPIYEGEPVLAIKLAPEGSTGGLSSTIQKGKRAISLQVNEIVGVAGYIRPGSLVDVMVNTREGGDKAVSKIILEKILVLAVAQDDKRDQTKPKVVSTVTLEVEPQQAEKIDLARNIGTLSLVLRNPLDSTVSTSAGAHRDDVLSAEMAQATQPAASGPVSAAVAKPAVRTRPAGTARSAAGVEVIRGVQKANSVSEGSK